MANQKGITPIIATLVLLLVTVAIAGAAWIYITTYVGGMTKQAIEVTSAECTSTGAQIYLRNIGTDVLKSSEIAVSRDIIAGSCNATAESWGATTIGPSAMTTYTDTNCTTDFTATARYTIIAGGRVQKIQINC